MLLDDGRNAGAAVTDPDLHAVAEVFGRSSEGGLITIAIDLGLTLRRRVKAVGNQIQNHPCDFLGKHVDLTSVRIKGPLQGVAQTGTVSSVDEKKPFSINRMCSRLCHRLTQGSSASVQYSGSAELAQAFLRPTRSLRPSSRWSSHNPAMNRPSV